MDQLTTLETSGIVGGVIAVLGALGRSVQWAFRRQDKDRTLREEKLRAWESRLQLRDNEYHLRIERRLAETERKLSVVSAALIATVAEVQLFEQGAVMLNRARQILHEAYPLAMDTPEDIAALLRRLT